MTKITLPTIQQPLVDSAGRCNVLWFEKLKFVEQLQPLSDIPPATSDDTKSNVIRTSFVVGASQDVDADWVGNLVFVAGTISLTIQPVSSVPMPAGTLQIDFLQYGAGTVQFVAGSGVTIVSKGSLKKLSGTGATAVLIYNGSDVWYLAGDLIS
jgi:hypothetical protein